MINLYEDKDYDQAVALKRKLLTAYLIVLGVCLAVCALFFTLFMLLPYAATPEIAGRKNLYLFLDCAISVAFMIFSFAYLCIPYRRAKYYLFMLEDMRIGEKTKNEGTFLQNEEEITDVRFVDFKVMTVLEWSEKKQEYMRRNVLVDKEKAMPNLKSGDIIVYVTHANVLMSYGYKSEEQVFDDFADGN